MLELSIIETEDRICFATLDWSIEPKRAIKVRYKNWRGEVEVRRIIPTGRMYYDSTLYHTEKQWLIEVVDIGNKLAELRHFAMADILEFIKE